MNDHALVIERAHINSVWTHPANPRQGDVGAIALSLRQHGQYRPIVVQRSTGYVLVGNHTLLAARSLGWSHIDAVFLDVDDEEAARILLVDNRTSDLAVYDPGALAAMLTDLAQQTEAGLAGTGFDSDDLDDLLADLAASEPTRTEGLDRQIVLTVPGDVYERALAVLARIQAATSLGASEAVLGWLWEWDAEHPAPPPEEI